MKIFQYYFALNRLYSKSNLHCIENAIIIRINKSTLILFDVLLVIRYFV